MIDPFGSSNPKQWNESAVRSSVESKKEGNGIDHLTFRESQLPVQDVTPENLIFYRIIGLFTVNFLYKIDPQLTMDSGRWIESYNCWITERWRKVQVTFQLPKDFQQDRPLEHEEEEKKKKASSSPTRSKSYQKTGSNISDMSDVKPQENIALLIMGTFTRNEYIQMVYDEKTKTYNYYDYMPPGTHHYRIVYQKDGNVENQVILLETDLTVKPRDKDIKPLKFVDIGKENEKFSKERSVFVDYRLDGPVIYKSAFESDMRFSKIYKVISKQEDVLSMLIYLTL